MARLNIKVPGIKLGLGTFINSDLDAKRMLVLADEFAFTAANYNRTFTQGVTRMATIQAVIIGRGFADDKGSASLNYHVGTISGGTVTIHNAGYASAAATNKRATTCSYWMIGTADPNRIVV